MAKNKVRTIADIAELAGVSKSTVSRALSDSPLISEETRERIQAIAREHNFQINQPARSLSLKQANAIAFVTHGYHKNIGVEDLFLLEMLGAITTALAHKSYDLLMLHVNPYGTDWIDDYLNTGKVDGFVLMTSTRKQYHIQKLVEMQAPFIAWGAPLPGTNFCTVTGDNFSGGRLATEHLLTVGRQNIAFLGGPAAEQEVKLRYQGYESALQAAGMQPEQNRVVHGEFSRPAAYEMMVKLLDQDSTVDGVVTNSDFMAIGAMDAIRDRGLQVPDDIAVVGYDDISLAEFSNPPLTTVRQNIPEAGRVLVENLIQFIKTGIVTNVSIPVTLVVRKSTVAG